MGGKTGSLLEWVSQRSMGSAKHSFSSLGFKAIKDLVQYLLEKIF